MAGGRPSKYKPEYCKLLLEHCRGGNSFESFGAVVGCGRSSLYRWEEEHEEFRNIRKEGFELMVKYYEDMGRALALGQLRRVKSEKVKLDDKGKPIIGPDGQVLYDREYEATQGNATAWIFLTKNLIGFRDKRDIELSGKDGGPIALTGLTDEELKKRLKELQDKAQKYIKDADRK